MATEDSLPLVAAPGAVQALLADRDATALLLDLGTPAQFAEGHVAGAVQLDFAGLLAAHGPTGGLLPPVAALRELFGALGLSAERHVVAYDRDGGGKAARCIWTLHALGFQQTTLMDGGFEAWQVDGLPVSTAAAPGLGAAMRKAEPGLLQPDASAVATTEWILAHLRDPDVVFLDTRSPAEFVGRDRRALRAGHIPGAVNFDWVMAMDPARQRRLLPVQRIRAMLADLGVQPDREVVAYCQTHHRSSHTYVTLRHCGFTRVRGYPGAWSEWGNLQHTPVA